MSRWKILILGELRKKNGQYLTTKSNKEEHGLGLKKWCGTL